MAQSYTPGLKVLMNTKMKKVRQLPLKGKVLVELGDEVNSDTTVASTFIPGNVQMLNVARQLNVEVDSVPDYMLVTVDSKVTKGQVIAETKGIFGLFKSQLKSPIDGTFTNVSNVTGQALISEPPIAIEVDAFSSGRIVEIIPEEGVLIESKGALVQGILGIGGENKGTIELLVDAPDEILTKDMIHSDHKGKIIVGGSYLTSEVFDHARKIGVNGTVVGGFDYTSLSDILGFNLGVAVTGSENLGISLMITEGFGRISMAQNTFNLFKHFNGKIASINGSTQIRAGVIRPEVIISHSEEIESKKLQEKDMIISEDSLVRIIRSPHFRKVAKVISLPTQLLKMESETMVRVAEIEFPDGKKATVPRANLELILY